MGAKDPNEIDCLVGSRVRQCRMQLGMSQELLAEQLGITVPQVQKYEKGVNRIGASRAAQDRRAPGRADQLLL